jgi:hypothetical protein
LGPDRVGTPVLRDSFKPDDFTLEAVTTTAMAPKQTTAFGASTRLARGLLLRRFRPPLATTVKLEDGQPTSIRNARFNAAVVRSAGPFRLSGQWWENLWARETLKPMKETSFGSFAKTISGCSKEPMIDLIDTLAHFEVRLGRPLFR